MANIGKYSLKTMKPYGLRLSSHNDVVTIRKFSSMHVLLPLLEVSQNYWKAGRLPRKLFYLKYILAFIESCHDYNLTKLGMLT